MSDNLADQLGKARLQYDLSLPFIRNLTDLGCRDETTGGDWKSKLQAPAKDSRVQTEVSSGLGLGGSSR